MGFPDFQYPENEKSYLPADQVLEFIESYADNFKLQDIIKFRHHVIRVLPLDDNQWEVSEFILVPNFNYNMQDGQ